MIVLNANCFFVKLNLRFRKLNKFAISTIIANKTT